MAQELARAKERERVERVIELEAAVAEVRRILTASHSLPHDWTIVQVADAIVEDIGKLRWQVRDTCARAEKAEEELARVTAERDEARTSWREAVALYEQEAARVDPALAELSALRGAVEAENEACAQLMEERAAFLRYGADKTIADWTGEGYSDADNRANRADAQKRRARAEVYDTAALAIRARLSRAGGTDA